MKKNHIETQANSTHLVEDFKNFAFKKNAMDMAIGITLGFAFGRLISSLVNDIIMPPLGILLAGINLLDLKIVLKKAVINAHNFVIEPEIALCYGKFIQVAIDFLIVAFSAFVILKILSNILHRKNADVDWTQFIKKP